jgi:hypothetical protein
MEMLNLDIIKLIKRSHLSVIGYTYESEYLIYDLLSDIDYTKYETIESLYRGIKLDSILDKKSNILIDIPSLRSKDVLNILSNLDDKVKVILITPIYETLQKRDIGKKEQFMGGNRLLYLADLVISISNSKIELVKNELI